MANKIKLEGEAQNLITNLCHMALKGFGLEALEMVKKIEGMIREGSLPETPPVPATPPAPQPAQGPGK